MNKNSFFLGLAIITLIIASLACGSSNTGTIANTVAPAATTGNTTSSTAEVATEAPTAEQPTATSGILIYKVGDVIQINDQTITLNTANITGDTLQANFTIENKGTSDITVSSMISFEAKGSDGTKLDQDYFNCPSGSLDGDILPGDKLKGTICWKGVSTDSVKIYYQADFLSQGATVWEITK